MGTPRATYTHGHPERVVASHASRTVADSAVFLVPRLRPGMRLLDLGCGPGTITAGLASLVDPGEVVGVDAAPEVLDRARAHVASLGVTNVTFRTADVLALPFPEQSFDVVYAHQLLQHLGDPVGALVEAARVLRPGGLVAVREADFATMTFHPENPTLDAWRSMYRAVHRANGGEPDAGRRLLEWANAAGFERITASSSTWTYADPVRRGEWADLWATRTTTPPFSDRAIALGLADAGSLQTVADAFTIWATNPDGWFSFIHGELLAHTAT